MYPQHRCGLPRQTSIRRISRSSVAVPSSGESGMRCQLTSCIYPLRSAVHTCVSLISNTSITLPDLERARSLIGRCTDRLIAARRCRATLQTTTFVDVRYPSQVDMPTDRTRFVGCSIAVTFCRSGGIRRAAVQQRLNPSVKTEGIARSAARRERLSSAAHTRRSLPLPLLSRSGLIGAFRARSPLFSDQFCRARPVASITPSVRKPGDRIISGRRSFRHRVDLSASAPHFRRMHVFDHRKAVSANDEHR